jgi:hypothetical protein
MKQRFVCIVILIFAAIVSGCATQKSYDYSAIRESKPRSIVVLPPLNLSPDIRATYSMLSTVTRPLAELGYYVFPVALVDQTFRENGLTEPGEMHNASPAKIAEIFGADAILYIKVNEYGATYRVISSEVIVSASAELIDARTGRSLWTGSAKALNSENKDTGGSGIVGILVTALIQQVANNIGDPGYQVARTTSYRLFSAGLLPGPRSPNYEKLVGQ